MPSKSAHSKRAHSKRSGSKRAHSKRRSSARRIDFSKIKWGSFTRRFKAWKKRHPHSKVDSLRAFAAHILAHPSRFSLRMRRKAIFYRNIILKGKVKMTIKPYVKKAKAKAKRHARHKKAKRHAGHKKAKRHAGHKKAKRHAGHKKAKRAQPALRKISLAKLQRVPRSHHRAVAA
jgi:hypothetical protein